jgi:hypothetical protein
MFGWWDSMTTTKKLTSLGILCLGTYLSFTFFQTKNQQIIKKKTQKPEKFDSEKSSDVSTAHEIEQKKNVNSKKNSFFLGLTHLFTSHTSPISIRTPSAENKLEYLLFD